MVLSPGAMAELASHQPDQLMAEEQFYFIVGIVLYFLVYYAYSQTVFVLFDHLDNASYTNPLNVLKRESSLNEKETIGNEFV